MVDFTAKLELPEFIPKEKIIGKYVLDSEVRHIGIVEDWTYSSDGKVKMVVRTKNLAKKNPVVLIPFSHIEKVGQFVLLKTKVRDFIERNFLTSFDNNIKKNQKKSEEKK